MRRLCPEEIFALVRGRQGTWITPLPPLLDALVDYHARDRYGFTPPGHRQGRGADPRTRAVLGEDTFRSDVLATAGLDDRTSSHGYLSRAEELMADAVGAEQAFFSTCGSSLSVKAAMLAVAGGQGDLLISRDAHKSVVAGLVFSAVQPQWIQPRYGTRLHVAHPPSPEQVEQAWQKHPDAAGALIVSPTPYGTCADISSIASLCHRRGKPLIVDEAWGAHLPFHPDLPAWALDGWRRQMVQHGYHLLDAALTLAGQVRQDIDALPGLHVLREEFLGAEASHDLDPLHVVIDVSDLGISGYDAADWLRGNHRLDMGLSDHRRVEATLSLADDDETAARLMSALTDLTKQASILPPARRVELPSAAELELEPAMLPRDAFFAQKETVLAGQAAGRICAEQITPYPPGIPVIIPGERITAELLDYLRSGVSAGMQLPDAADPALDKIRVVRRH